MAREALEIVIHATDEASGALKNVKGMLGELKDTAGMLGSIGSTLGIVTGIGSATAAMGVLSGAIKHGVGLSAEMEVRLAGVDGYSKTLMGTWDKMGLTVDGLSMTLADPLMPALQSAIEGMNDLFNSPEVEAGVQSLAKAIRTDLVPAIEGIPEAVRGIITAWGALQGWMDTTDKWLNESAAFIHKSFFGWMPEFAAEGKGGAMGEDFWQRHAPPPLPAWVTDIPASTLAGLRSLDVKEFRDLIREGEIANLLNAGQPADRWAGMNIFGGKQRTGLDLQDQYMEMIRSLYPKDGLGKAGAGIATAGLSMSMPDLMALAFPDVASAQGWQGAFAGQHGGRAPGITDLRDRQASLLFAQKYGKAPTEEEWKERYYKGGFKGEDKLGLDELFGKPGTWDTLISEKGKQEAEANRTLAEAFKKALRDSPLPVQIVGASSGGGGSGGDNLVIEHSSTTLARARM